MIKIWTGIFIVTFCLLFYNQFIDKLNLLEVIQFSSLFLMYWQIALFLVALFSQKFNIRTKTEFLIIRLVMIFGLYFTYNSADLAQMYLSKAEFNSGLILYAVGMIYLIIYEDKHKNIK